MKSLAILLLLTSISAANNIYWQPTGNVQWYTTANWDAGHYPSTSDTAIFFGQSPTSYYATGGTITVGGLQVQGTAPLLITSYALVTGFMRDYAPSTVTLVTDLSCSGTLTKSGSGLLVLSGKDSFGSISNQSGTIALERPSSCGSLIVGRGGTFLYDPQFGNKPPTPVPEPQTVALLVTALLVLHLTRRPSHPQ